MTVGLTRQQSNLLTFINSYSAEHGITPSFAEMMAGVGLKSKSSVHRILGCLEDRGFITRRPARPRSVIPVTVNAITLHLPSDLDAAVRSLAQQHGVSSSDVVIEALRDGLKAHDRQQIAKAVRA